MSPIAEIQPDRELGIAAQVTKAVLDKGGHFSIAPTGVIYGSEEGVVVATLTRKDGKTSLVCNDDLEKTLKDAGLNFKHPSEERPIIVKPKERALNGPGEAPRIIWGVTDVI